MSNEQRQATGVKTYQCECGRIYVNPKWALKHMYKKLHVLAGAFTDKPKEAAHE